MTATSPRTRGRSCPVYPVLVRIVTIVGLPWNVGIRRRRARRGPRRRARVPPADVAVPRARPGDVRGRAVLGRARVADHAVRLRRVARLPAASRRRCCCSSIGGTDGSCPLVAAWSFTRPGALAFALTLGLHWVMRWFRAAAEPVPDARARARGIRRRVRGARRGSPGRASRGRAPGARRTPTPSWPGARRTSATRSSCRSRRGSSRATGGSASPSARSRSSRSSRPSPSRSGRRGCGRLGVDIRLWLGSYALYLLAVFFPQSSTFRLLAPMFPILGALAVPRSRLYGGRWSCSSCCCRWAGC